MFKKISFALVAMVMFMFASCNDGGNDGGYMQGVFTVQHSVSPILWMDGGHMVYPSAAAAAQLQQNNAFKTADRVLLVITYKDEDMTIDANNIMTVRNAEVAQGSIVPTTILRSPEMASIDKNFDNYLSPDSINSFYQISNETGLWFYKGYMTVQYLSTYYIRDNKGVLPTVLATYSFDESKPEEVTINLYLNKHSKKSSETESGEATNFISSINIADMQEHVMRNSLSQVKFTINYQTKMGTQTISRTVDKEQFFRPF